MLKVQDLTENLDHPHLGLQRLNILAFHLVNGPLYVNIFDSNKFLLCNNHKEYIGNAIGESWFLFRTADFLFPGIRISAPFTNYFLDYKKLKDFFDLDTSDYRYLFDWEGEIDEYQQSFQIFYFIKEKQQRLGITVLTDDELVVDQFQE